MAITPAVRKQHKELIEVEGDTLRFNFHFGQWRAWESRARDVAVVAGNQSGKTSFGPIWLWREIQLRGPGDYAVVTPTFTLLEVKALPEFKRLFEQILGLGKYVASPIRKFTFSAEGALRTFGYVPEVPVHVYFGYAEDPDSLESGTYKAVWADEAGQKKFKRESFEALRRRLSIFQGRMLITTTPYFEGGWLRTEIFDKAKAGDPSVEVVNFPSNINPAYPQEEFETARRDLPSWKFNLFYLGLLDKPAGLIYDCFDANNKEIVRPRVPLPDHWKRYLGLDFGGVNTAGLFLAEEPNTPRLWAYREYHAGGRTAAEHTKYLLEGEGKYGAEPMVPFAVGGSKSEGQWRLEFQRGGYVDGRRVPGLAVLEPDISDVFLGIQRVYGAHKREEIIVFDDLHMYLDQKATYSYKLDDRGNVVEPKQIEDKATFHLMDGERYIVGYLKRGEVPFEAIVGGQRSVYVPR